MTKQKRFQFVHEFMSYKDYDSSRDADEPVLRLTTVNQNGNDPEKAWAYLSMKDGSEKRITIEEAENLLKEEV